jgi:tetratricopeptide (TPR) repeat protein
MFRFHRKPDFKVALDFPFPVTTKVRFRIPSEPFVRQKRALLQIRREQPEASDSMLHELVTLHEQHHQPEKARKYLRHLIGLDPSLSKQAAVFAVVGRELLNRKCFRLAEKYLRMALRLERQLREPTDSTYVHLGGCYNGLKNFTRAEKCCRCALEIDPAAYRAHEILGAALHGQGRYRAAAQIYVVAGKTNYRLCQPLGKLLESHPELRADFGDEYERMRQAWNLSMQARPYFVDRGLRRWRRLFKQRLCLWEFQYRDWKSRWSQPAGESLF